MKLWTFEWVTAVIVFKEFITFEMTFGTKLQKKKKKNAGSFFMKSTCNKSRSLRYFLLRDQVTIF